MGTVTIRVRSLVWFVTGAVVAVVVMWVMLSAWRVEAAPGDSDTTFVPITPGCRFADTRQAGQGGPIGPGQVRQFTAHGTNNACTIPPDAVALLMNVTVDNQTAPNSFLTFWGNGAYPGTSALNPAAGEPPTPNAVTTDLTPTGQFNVRNDAGFVNVIIDIGGYYTKASLQELSTRLAGVEAKLASMSATTVGGRPTVRFTGVNVQVVDGTGDSQCSSPGTEPCNGLGNLIVGYNEGLGGEARTGSHNIVGGINNDWTSFSGLVVGWTNKISGGLATVTGGTFNEASGGESSISGGFQNTATGTWSSVSGGDRNTASGFSASVSGGELNEASGNDSSVSGGARNTASGPSSSVSGGSDNSAIGTNGSVLGGNLNSATNDNATASGGSNNTSAGVNSSVSGGRQNSVIGSNAVVAGGRGCSLVGGDATVYIGRSDGFDCPKIN